MENEDPQLSNFGLQFFKYMAENQEKWKAYGERYMHNNSNVHYLILQMHHVKAM